MGDVTADSPSIPVTPMMVFETPNFHRLQSRLNDASTTDQGSDIFHAVNDAELMALSRHVLAKLQARGIQQHQSADNPPLIMPAMAPIFPPPATGILSR